MAEHSSWLELGEFDSQGIWHVDKKQIQTKLENGIRKNQFCPIINQSLIMNTLKKLPKTINPKKDTGWNYKTSYQETNGHFKEVITGVKPVLSVVKKYLRERYEQNSNLCSSFKFSNE